MQTQIQECDVLIIGAGIAGASAGYFLLKDNSSINTVMLEAESVTSFHTTGRSAAFLLPFYGGDKVVPLTSFSKNFYSNPPSCFGSSPLLQYRGALHIAREEQLTKLSQYYDDAVRLISGLEKISGEQVCELIPVIDKKYVRAGVYDPGCYDLDVSAIHSGFIRGFKQNGGSVITNAEVVEITKEKQHWLVSSKAGVFRAKTIVNASGAWGDEVAKMANVKPIGLAPLRRTVVVCPTRGEVDKKWPLVIDVDEDFYFKPEGDKLLASPGDETLSEPCDSQPEEIDVAQVVHSLETVLGGEIKKVESKWAGLRTFTPDRVPAIGFDQANEGFFWCVGQGGFGIQTAAAIGQMSASLISRGDLSEELKRLGVEAISFNPERFNP